MIQEYLPEPFIDEPLPRFPIAIESPFKSTRIAAQKGVFTLHGRLKMPVESYAALRPYLEKIELSGAKIKPMKVQLSIAGISETTVFPELTGLCRELIELWKSEDDDAPS